MTKVKANKTSIKEVLETKNEAHGFYGKTVADYSSTEKAEKRWAQAFILLRELSNFSPEIIRRYLDSRAGRYLADDSYNKDLANTIIRKWQKGLIQNDLYSSEYKVSDERFYAEY